MNSREKGKRGERQWRDELRAQGYGARRGQQFCGGEDSPDVVCEDLPWIHFEVKAVERLDVYGAMEQARRDARRKKGEGGRQNGGKIPVVAHRRRFWPWLVTMEAEGFFRILSGDLAVGHRGDLAVGEKGEGAAGWDSRALPGGIQISNKMAGWDSPALP